MSKLMQYGAKLGCHQRPDRSFFFRGKQLPVCARCTGVIVGQILALVIYPFVKPDALICIAFCGCLFLDWVIQYLKIRESTNVRRFITGILCGYGMLSIEISIILKIVTYLFLLCV